MSPNEVIEEEDELDELDSDSDDEPRKGKQTNGRISNKASHINAKKRKLVDANSAPTSANLKSHKADDADQGGNPLEKHSTTRPAKKRKVEVEVVKFDSEEEVESRKSLTQSQSRTGSQQQLATPQESYPLQKVRGKVAVPQDEDEDEDDEEEERMVEDALSEVASPRPEFVENPVDDDFYTPYDTVDIANAQDSDKDHEEEAEEIIIPKTSKPTAKPSTTKKKAKSTNVASSSPSSYSSLLPAPLVPVKIGPPAQKRPTAKSNAKQPLIKRPHFGPSHLTSPGPSQHSFRSGSLPSLQYPVSQDDLPGPSHIVLPPAPTKEPSVFYNANDDEHVPILSPAALRRLAQFDEEVMGVKEGKKKAIDPQEEDTESEVEIVAERLTRKPGPLFIPDPSSPLNRTPTASPMMSLDDVNARNEEPTAIQRKNHATDDEIRSTTSKKTNDHPKPTDITPNPAPEPPTHSYDNDIVPETDQSQSQELKLPIAGPSTPKNSSAITRQGSLKSRMKPRTRTPSSPFGAKPSTNNKDRPLRPIPMLSPSTFHPLLSIPELDSSLPDSIIEPAERSGDAEDLEAPMSSIEEFDSPVKDPKKRTTLVLKGKGRARSKSTASNVSGRESASEIWDSQVVQRGQAIAEAAKKKKNNGFDVPSRPKRTVEEILAAVAAAATSKRRHGSTAEADEDEDMADLSTVPVPPASGPPVIDEESITVQEMEATYIDLSGGSGEPPIDPVQLRQEEEESTQDLMLELNQVQEQQRGMDSIDLEGGWAAGPPAASSKDSEQGSSRGGRLEVIPEVRVFFYAFP